MPGVDEIDYLTNSSMMDVDFLPRHLIVVGGSYIGLEFGADVPAVRERRSPSSRWVRGWLPREDEDVSAAMLRDPAQSEGISVRV